MFYNLRKKINRNIYDYSVRDIRDCVHISTDENSNFTLLTQLCPPDVNMYLVAVSSFCQFLKPKKIVIVSDRLSDDDLHLLHACIEDLVVVPVAQALHPKLPTGGCWERLISVHNFLADSYVVQLDADTITLKYPQDVADAIKQNRSFTLTTKMGVDKWTLAETSKRLESVESEHVQVSIEKAFVEMVDSDTRLYIRGCAGFAGFARGSTTVQKLVEFSQEAEALVGAEKWFQWGSEQVASNFVVANSENSIILPFSLYPYYEPGVDLESPCFLHFIGDYRYEKGKYIALSRKVIGELTAK